MKNIMLFMIISISSAFSQYNPHWVKVYNVGLSTEFGINFAAVDLEGNSYVCGFKHTDTTETDIFLMKLDTFGDTLWLRWFNSQYDLYDYPTGLVVNSHNEPIISGQIETPTGSDALLIKYTSGGDTLWTKFFGNPDTSESFRAITLDKYDNIYVTGSSGRMYSTAWCFTSMYSSFGNLEWVDFYGGFIPYKYYYGISICIDPTNNFCYTSVIGSQGNKYDISIVKYDRNFGDIMWSSVCFLDSNFFNIDFPNFTGKSASDKYGYVYLGTHTADDGWGQVNEDFLLIKINSIGDSVKFRTYESTINSDSRIVDLKVDNEQNVYVTGPTEEGYNGAANWAVIKYDTNLVDLWTNIYDRKNFHDVPVGLFFDKQGNIVVGGTTKYQGFTGSDYSIIRYTPEGDFLDSLFYLENRQETCTAMAMDSAGNIILTGGWGTGGNIGTIKLLYNSNSSCLKYFRNNLNKPINDLQNTSDTILINTDEPIPPFVYDVNLIIDTVLHTNDSDLVFLLTHYGLTDTILYHAGEDGDNFIGTVLNDSASTPVPNGSAPFTGEYKPYQPLSKFNAYSPSGEWVLNVYDKVSGNTGILEAWSLQFIMVNPLSIRSNNKVIPDKPVLYQNYPNPFNPLTKIRFVNPVYGQVTLKIYDILGNEIASLLDEEKAKGEYEVDFSSRVSNRQLASGVYIYQLRIGKIIQTKKMIILK